MKLFSLQTNVFQLSLKLTKTFQPVIYATKICFLLQTELRCFVEYKFDVEIVASIEEEFWRMRFNTDSAHVAQIALTFHTYVHAIEQYFLEKRRKEVSEYSSASVWPVGSKTSKARNSRDSENDLSGAGQTPDREDLSGMRPSIVRRETFLIVRVLRLAGAFRRPEATSLDKNGRFTCHFEARRESKRCSEKIHLYIQGVSFAPGKTRAAPLRYGHDFFNNVLKRRFFGFAGKQASKKRVFGVSVCLFDLLYHSNFWFHREWKLQQGRVRGGGFRE